MTAAIRNSQEKMKAAINSIWFALEGSIRHWVEDVLASVDQQMQGLCEELSENIEQMQSGLQAVTTFLNHRIQVEETQTTKTLVETTWSVLKAKIAEVMDHFVKGLDLTQCKFKKELKEVEA
jgi:hypothetical protein